MTSSAACCALGQWSHQLSNISSTSWMSKRWNTTMWMRRLSISGRRIGKTTGRLRTLMITLRVPFCMLYVSMWMYSKYQKYKSICFHEINQSTWLPQNKHQTITISVLLSPKVHIKYYFSPDFMGPHNFISTGDSHLNFILTWKANLSSFKHRNPLQVLQCKIKILFLFARIFFYDLLYASVSENISQFFHCSNLLSKI